MASRVQAHLQIEAFAPDPLRIETLFVRRADAHHGATLRAFEAALDELSRSPGAPQMRAAVGSPATPESPGL